MKNSLKSLPHAESGQVLIFTLSTLALILVVTMIILTVAAASGNQASRAVATTQARGLAEAGLERAIQQLGQDASWLGEENQSLGAGTYSVSVADVVPGVTNRKRITATGAVPNQTAPAGLVTLEVIVTGSSAGDQVTFQFAVQAGDNGIDMHLGSRIRGNVWSNGPIIGSSTAQNQVITGSATSANAGGELERVQVNGAAAAHTLDRMIASGNGTAYQCQNSTIFGNLQAPVRTACTVSGSWNQQTPPDPEPQALPITAAVVADLRESLVGAPTHSGNLTIPGFVPQTLGPLVITGNLTLSTAANVTLTGNVSVIGNIVINNSSTVTTDPTVYQNGAQTAFLLADGNFDARTGTRFIGLSPILAIAATGNALLGNSVRGDNVLFVSSPSGNTDMNNGAVVKQISSKKIILRNFAEIPTFPSQVVLSYGSAGGGSGVWQIEPDSWHIIPPG